MTTLLMLLLAQDSWGWTTDAPAPVAMQGGGVVNGKLYMAGGLDLGLGTISNETWEFDPETEDWTQKASMPTPLCAMSSAVLNGEIYFCGGSTNGGDITSMLLRYDPATDTWATLAPAFYARWGSRLAAANGRLYLIGGTDEFWWPMIEVEEYDPDTNVWVGRAGLPEPLAWMFAGTIGGKVYAAGGDLSNSTYEYDPVADSWTQRTNMPVAVYGGASVVAGGRLLCLSGLLGFSTAHLGALEYDPVTDAWTTLAAAPVAQDHPWGAFLDGKAHVIGSYSFEPRTTHLEYTPVAVEPEVLPAFEESYDREGKNGDQSCNGSVPGTARPLVLFAALAAIFVARRRKTGHGGANA